jgi:5'-nucleotidase
MSVKKIIFVAAFLVLGCTAVPRPENPSPRADDLVTISIIGTNDLHGHVRALPLLGGYLANLRRVRADDGAVVLLDGGDMFQGTLESNLGEGEVVVSAYEVLGYDAVAIGNHEFDYGPSGPRTTPREPGDEPRGALAARVRQAGFPFLNANLVERDTNRRLDLGLPSVLLERASIPIGVIGVSTEQTLTTTIAANVADLDIRPLAREIATEARALRQQGAAVVIVAAHAGGDCERFEEPDDLASCDPEQEIFEVARELPSGLVDAIVAGHTHRAVAHRVNGIPIIEAYSYGVAFGRVDLEIDRSSRRVVGLRLHPPQHLCGNAEASPEQAFEMCAPPPYEGMPVLPDARVAAVIAPTLERAAVERERRLGPTLVHRFEAQYATESALGNFLVDLMLEARGDADAALINGGGLRADLPEGPLQYGALYQAFPFDNRFAIVQMSAGDLAQMIAENLASRGGILSIGGLRARARCETGELRVSLMRGDGRPVQSDEILRVLTSDFLATGREGMFQLIRERTPDAIAIEDGPPIREAMMEVLTRHGETVFRAVDFYDPEQPRIAYEGTRPLSCDPTGR